ncbi:MAG: hypothetical protein ACP5HU_13525 [Phycisphaerae bacterium]
MLRIALDDQDRCRAEQRHPFEQQALACSQLVVVLPFQQKQVAADLRDCVDVGEGDTPGQAVSQKLNLRSLHDVEAAAL